MKAEIIPFDIKLLNPYRELDTKVLEWINDIRDQFNAPPIDRLPSGIPLCPVQCVIANAFSDIGEFWVNTHRLVKGMGTDRVQSICEWPEYVKDFIHAFDNGLRPDLEVM